MGGRPKPRHLPRHHNQLLHPGHHSPASDQKWIDCSCLAVDPAYQRRGCGEKLIEWVSTAAAREDVPVFCDSTDMGLSLYLRHGARRIGKILLPARVVDSEDGTEPVRLEAVEVVPLMGRAEWAVSGTKSGV